jgi:tryptophanyl-tRNA synthetase
MKKKILLSGVKPTGRPHLGNYFGAMKQFVDMQNDFESYVFIANYHALTGTQTKEQLIEDTRAMALDYLGIGLDPKNVVLFKQSDVPELTELTWIFNCQTTMPYLMRAHAFKDAEAKNKDINIGTFDYPILMASDILMYDSEVVPVGKDQRQHVEMAREIAQKFNSTYGESFTLPQEKVLEHVATVPGTDGQKMSKSYGNTIPLFGTDEEIKKAVMSIVTDSKTPEEKKDPESCNVFALHKLVTPEPELSEIRMKYEEGGMGYKESKDRLLANILALVTPLREKRKFYEENPVLVDQILKEGEEKAKAKAEAKMEVVRKLVGLM